MIPDDFWKLFLWGFAFLFFGLVDLILQTWMQLLVLVLITLTIWFVGKVRG